MTHDDETHYDLLKVQMDLRNIEHFLLSTPLGYKRDLVDAELRRLWARWDTIDACARAGAVSRG